MAEGKQHALAIGITSLSTEDMWVHQTPIFTMYWYTCAVIYFRAKVNKGIGVENCHYLNDGLWHMKPIK